RGGDLEALKDAVKRRKVDLSYRNERIEPIQNRGRTLLIEACACLHLDIVQWLLESYVDVNEQDDFGFSAAAWCIFSWRNAPHTAYIILELLLNQPSFALEAYDKGLRKTYLSRSVMTAWKGGCKLLIGKGAKVTEEDAKLALQSGYSTDF